MLRPISLAALAAAIAVTTYAPAAMAAPSKDSARVTMPASTEIKPPVAAKRPHTYTVHGITVEDPYDWLYDKSYPTVDDTDVLDHLKAENAFFEAQMEGQKAL
ncbi:MAG: S9 family peptidase, partial [Erythrobacter sp.]|nr:S9 family peptidase [Erythrobacter sp.]